MGANGKANVINYIFRLHFIDISDQTNLKHDNSTVPLWRKTMHRSVIWLSLATLATSYAVPSHATNTSAMVSRVNLNFKLQALNVVSPPSRPFSPRLLAQKRFKKSSKILPTGLTCAIYKQTPANMKMLSPPANRQLS